MKHPKGQQSSRCMSAVVLLKAASARKMDNKDDEAEEPDKQEKLQKGTTESEQHQSQNIVAHSSTRSLPAHNTKTDGSGTMFEAKQPIQQPQNEDRESAQTNHGILRDEAHLRPNSEEWGLTSNSLSREPSPSRVQIQDISGIPVESTESSELNGSIGTPKSSRPSNSLSESIEGEFELGNQENMGPTLGQYRYQTTREDYEALSKSLLEKTINTLIHLGEVHKSAYADSQPPKMRAPLPPRMSQDTAEAQVFLVDKEMKLIARRINESKREQAYTLQRINDLEVKMFKKQGADYIREIMTKIPKEEDLKDMEQIRQLMLERKRLQKEIEKLKMEMSSMNKAMANADVIISDCAAIKKPRRVVICTRMPSQPFGQESSSREVIGRGESPSKASSPTTTTDMSDLAVASGSDGLGSEPEEPAQQSNVPETTEPVEQGDSENSVQKGKQTNEKKTSQ